MKTVYAYAHTHWDREWYREFGEFQLRLVEVVDDVLSKLENNELSSFYFDGQTAALEDYLEIRPEKENIIKKLINEKKLYIGPYYCSTDSFLVSAEALIRNLQIGIRKSQAFGCSDFIAYHADTFGHSVQLPEIIRHFNIDCGIFWRGCGELPSEFIFNGLKAIYLIQGYFQDIFSLDISIEKKAELLKNTLDKISRYSGENILLPLGADHLGLPNNLEQQINEVNEYLSDYKILLTTPFEYLKISTFKQETKEELRDNTKNFILPGVLSSRRDIKQYNSLIQWEMTKITEPFQTICNGLGKSKNFQPVLDSAWKTLIKNQAHDSIYGCSLDSVHRQNKARFEEASQIINAVKNSVKRDIDGQNLCVFNFSNYGYTGAVCFESTEKQNAQLIGIKKGFPLKKVYSINQIPVTEDYTQIYEYIAEVENAEPFSLSKIVFETKSTSLLVTETSIENKNLKLEICENKINLTDKKNNKIYRNFIRITDRADIGDSYNFGALKNDIPIVAKIKETFITEKGPVRSTLRIVLELLIPKDSDVNGRSNILKEHTIYLDAILENSAKFIRFNVVWENKAKEHLMQVEFAFDNNINETVSDDLLNTVKRSFDPSYDIYKNIPAPRGIELKYNIAPSQSFVMTNGAGILSNRNIEYEVFENKLRLTLLRSTGVISNPLNSTRGTPAGPPLPTPELEMLGNNQDSFGVAFSDENAEMIKYSEFFRGCTLSTNTNIEPQTFFKKPACFNINAVKLNKEGNVVLRFFNMSEKTEHFLFETTLPYKKIYIGDALENKTQDFSPVDVKPNSFITLIIEQ